MREKWRDETASGEDAEAHALASDRDTERQGYRDESASERDGGRDGDKTGRKTTRDRDTHTQLKRKCAGERDSERN